MDSWWNIIRNTVLSLLGLALATHSAPIGQYSLDNLNVSIQIDGLNNLHGRLYVTLNSSSHHLVNVSTLWPMFTHALHRVSNQSSYFSVIGIHAHQRNITLCDVASGKYHSVLNGTNLGLVWKLKDLELVCLHNPHPTPINVLIVFNLYDNFHPIPGGCNIEFALENSPFILVHRRPSSASGPLIDYIEFQPAALGNERSPGRQCGQLSGARLNYDLYAYYGRHGGSEGEAEHEYFHTIDSMSNRKWLARHATLIRRIGHRHDSSSSLSFLRLFIITSLNQQIYFNILAIDDDAATDDGDYHSGIATTNSTTALDWTSAANTSSGSTLQTWATTTKRSLASLYVPSQIVSHVAICNYAQLFISLSTLSLFSVIVSIIGFRHFILELFYFSFLLSLGSFLVVCSKLTSSATTPLPSLSPWFLACSIVSSLMIATFWTELCRRTRNVKLAFCGHSLTLSICFVAFTFDLFISLPVTSSLLSHSQYLYYAVVLAIMLCHGTFLLYLDYFLLSALSTSFATVYIILLPFDLYFFSGILFRVLFQMWLVLTQFSTNSASLIVTFITFNARDVFLVVIFTLLVSSSLYWQCISKLASQGYGFGCLAPKCAKKDSASSIGHNSKLQVQPKNNHNDEKTKAKKRKRQKSSLRSRKSKSGSPPRKLYRCKHCQKYSTSRTRKRTSCTRLRQSRSHH